MNRLFYTFSWLWIASIMFADQGFPSQLTTDERVTREKVDSKQEKHSLPCLKKHSVLTAIFVGAILGMVALIACCFYYFSYAQKSAYAQDLKAYKETVIKLRDMVTHIVGEDFQSSSADCKGELDRLRTILLSGKKANGNESYAYSIGLIRTQMGISLKKLLALASLLAKREKDPINLFAFGSVIYMGFASRGKAYIEDEKKGVNPIANSLTNKQRQNKPITILELTK